LRSRPYPEAGNFENIGFAMNFTSEETPSVDASESWKKVAGCGT
jgi:hypothetical protein